MKRLVLCVCFCFCFCFGLLGHALANDGGLQVKRLNEPGPIAGVLARVPLGDANVQVLVLPAGEVLQTGGTGTFRIKLDTVTQAARTHGLALAMNASFFGVDARKTVGAREVAYFVGNLGFPVGWHMSAAQLLATPRSDKLRATLVIHQNGLASIADNVRELPADALHAVSGNAMLLDKGSNLQAEASPTKAPRSAVGITADGKTLLLLAVDGRSAHSKGASLSELAQLLLREGAHWAINLDGGGSTAFAVRDPVTGTQALANTVSDPSAASPALGLRAERPVVDVIGVRVLNANLTH